MPFLSDKRDSYLSVFVSRVKTTLRRLLGKATATQRRMPSAIKLEAVLASMTDAVVIMDKSGIFIDFNEPFAHLNRFRTKNECAIALEEYPAIFQVATTDGSPVPPEDWPLARALRGESGVNVELHVRRLDSGEHWTGLYNYAPIHADDNSIVGSVLTGRDITNFRKTEESLRDLSSRLQLALTSAHLGFWEWDIRYNKLSWDDRMFELYGLKPENFSPEVGTWETSVHPEDRESAKAALYAAVRGERVFDTQFRVVHPDGRVIHLKANGLVVLGKDGSADRMLGVNADITEEKLAKDTLQNAYAQVEAKVVERTAQLEAAKVAAENANKAKDLFLATLSHELRSPLSAILSWTQLMERGILPPEKVQIGIRTIKESVWAQNQLIGDLLDLSRISTGKLHVDRQPTNVIDVLRAAEETIRPIAEQRGLTIKEQFESEEVYIYADPARLKQSFWNILSNALKFTPSGGTISLSVSCVEQTNGSWVNVIFKDTGRGINPEFLPHLFERFSQADPSSVRVHGGMGLGLAIVKSLTELQEGTIRAESAGEGKGATFILSFPIISAATLSLTEDGSATGLVGRSDSQDLQQIKILLVEDGEKTRIALAQLLAAQGAIVRAEASAIDALTVFPRFLPDIVVSDIAMPQEDGHSLMRKIRALGPERGGDTPAIALTAYAEPRDRDEAFAAGFQEYLNKPVDAAKLATTILKLTRPRHSWVTELPASDHVSP